MSTSIILCGVGGQGTILASKLIADAAMARGIPVKSAETIGMAQRGGSVFSNVRLGEGVSSPLIGKGKADLIIAFEPAEAVRMLPYLRPGGKLIMSDRPIVPVSAMTGGPAYDLEAIMSFLRLYMEDLIVIDCEKAFADLGSTKVLNVILLGAAARTGLLGLDVEDIRSAILARVPERFHELNMRALDYTGHFE